jgi:hypothetical protein
MEYFCTSLDEGGAGAVVVEEEVEEGEAVVGGGAEGVGEGGEAA